MAKRNAAGNGNVSTFTHLIKMMNFQINDRVRRIKEDPNRQGTVVELEDLDGLQSRCRVLWDAVPGQSGNYAKAKRTWLKPTVLTKVN